MTELQLSRAQQRGNYCRARLHSVRAVNVKGERRLRERMESETGTFLHLSAAGKYYATTGRAPRPRWTRKNFLRLHLRNAHALPASLPAPRAPRVLNPAGKLYLSRPVRRRQLPQLRHEPHRCPLYNILLLRWETVPTTVPNSRICQVDRAKRASKTTGNDNIKTIITFRSDAIFKSL